MPSLGSIWVDIVARTGKFEDGMKKATGSVVSLQNGLKAAGAIGATAFLAATASLSLIAPAALEAASALKDTSDRLQVTTDDLQKYQYAAKLAGVDSGTLESALTKLNSRIADGELKFSSTTEAIESIADAVRGAKTDMERAAIVNDAFGAKMGAKFIPILMGGADGLKRLGDEAERTGNIIGSSTIDAADDLADQIDILGGTIKNNFTNGFLESFVDNSLKLSDVYKDKDFTNGIENLGKAFGGLAGYLLDASAALGTFLGKYNALAEAVSGKGNPLDSKFFAFLAGVDKKLGRSFPTQAAPADNYDYSDIDTVSADAKKRRPWVSSQTIKDNQTAADKAAASLKAYSKELDLAALKADSWAFLTSEAGDRAAKSIEGAFADFLFDPLDKGFKGMLLSFVDTLRRMAAEAAAANIAKSLFGGKDTQGTGGVLSGLMNSVLGAFGGGKSLSSGSMSMAGSGGLLKFAEGGFLEPGQWGIAGEREAELIYGGRSGMTVIPPDKMGGGGNTYQIDARGADIGAVRRIEQSLLALAGPGVIEQRVTDAQSRGKL